jgi:hypothetical protein
VKIIDVNPDFVEKKFVLQVQRTVLGTVVRDVFSLSGIFVHFWDSSVEVDQFPCHVAFKFSVMCLGSTE